MNVGELREALKDVPDDYYLYLNDAYRVTPVTAVKIERGSVELR